MLQIVHAVGCLVKWITNTFDLQFENIIFNLNFLFSNSEKKSYEPVDQNSDNRNSWSKLCLSGSRILTIAFCFSLIRPRISRCEESSYSSSSSIFDFNAACSFDRFSISTWHRLKLTWSLRCCSSSIFFVAFRSAMTALSSASFSSSAVKKGFGYLL